MILAPATLGEREIVDRVVAPPLSDTNKNSLDVKVTVGKFQSLLSYKLKRS